MGAMTQKKRDLYTIWHYIIIYEKINEPFTGNLCAPQAVFLFNVNFRKSSAN